MICLMCSLNPKRRSPLPERRKPKKDLEDSEETDSEKDNWDGPQENGRDQQLSMPDEKEDKKYSKYDNLR